MLYTACATDEKNLSDMKVAQRGQNIVIKCFEEQINVVYDGY
jgi:acetolactate synthase small subunit